MLGCPYGTHRVLDPPGQLPQGAWRLDNNFTVLYDNEILIDVDMLNIDAASFRQIKVQAGANPAKMSEIIADTVIQRGKQHNPVTGSGDMLTGTVARIGPVWQGLPVQVGDRIASLVSLSLTPLRLDKILEVDSQTDQVVVSGLAVLFESSIFERIPPDMTPKLALAVLDVAGAPAQTAKIVKPDDTVVVIGGGGKSGLLCLHEACKHAGINGQVIGISRTPAGVARMRESGLPVIPVCGDAQDPMSLWREIECLTKGALADVTINVVDVPNTEIASILATKDRGTVYFFSMATSFTAAALGAEGIGKDVTMLIGNGYTAGHASFALRSCAKIAHCGGFLNGHMLSLVRERLGGSSLTMFAGLAKNVGKTTALNSVNALFCEQVIGLTSIGYDGEPYDALHQYPKHPSGFGRAF